MVAIFPFNMDQFKHSQMTKRCLTFCFTLIEKPNLTPRLHRSHPFRGWHSSAWCIADRGG